MNSPVNERSNPYVGPRAFKYGEILYGRDRELPNLVDLLIAERIILLYSPSGAGKTSLLQAALIPELEKEDFQVFPVMRVSLESPEVLDEGSIRNRYIFSVLISLEEGLSKEDQTSMEDLAQLTLGEYLGRRKATKNEPKSEVLIFDQFEEILTANPADKGAKKDFFAQLGEVLQNRDRWAIFAMREEYIAGLDPYLHHMPTRFSNTFRLELLGEKSAIKAMQNPAAKSGVIFTDDAALKMINDLRRMWIQQPDGSKKPELGPYIEPVQLQVVCLKLWDKLPDDDVEIGEDDIENLGDVNSALAAFYDEQLEAIAGKCGTKERLIREWFEHQLITEQGVRRDVLQGEDLSQGLDNEVIWSLVNAHIVRPERRRGFTWFELAHDRLIEPVRASNAAWFEANLNPFQRQALLWERQGRPRALLYDDKMLLETEQWGHAHSNELTETEREFLTLCKEDQTVLERERKQRKRIRLLISASIILVFFLAYLGYTNWSKNQPWAYLKSIATGNIHALRGFKVTIGRNAGGIENEINLIPTIVSRLHLLILNNHYAYDMRSLNGTTINGEFLHYGTNRKLLNNDIIVLTGTAPFRFETSYYPAFMSLFKAVKRSASPKGWAILIDGESRSIFYMDEKQYYLTMDEKNKYLLEENENDKSLLKIRRYDTGRITIEDMNDEMILLATMKEGDYFYNKYDIPSGSEYDSFETTRKDRRGNLIAESHDIFEVSYSYKGKPFQIVPIIENLEADSPNGY